MTYQSHYFLINSSIPECNHIRETRNPEPRIEPASFSQAWSNQRVDGYGSGFSQPSVHGLGFGKGLEPNQSVFAVPTWTAGALPGTVANTIPD